MTFLRVVLDKKLTWNPHISSKPQQECQRLKSHDTLPLNQSTIHFKLKMLPASLPKDSRALSTLCGPLYGKMEPKIKLINFKFSSPKYHVQFKMRPDL